jgi:exodeoxyribonuclease VII large subunit
MKHAREIRMTEANQINVVEFTVTELSAALKRTVEDAYGYVRVRGEISGYKGPHTSGHVYFAIKDEGAKIEAVIWKGVFGRMRIKPTEGLEVVITGKLTTYPNRSSYQIIVETLEPAGLGALMALLEERKKMLTAEGLFDDARKQLLPFLPTVIGVVTSPTGAVIRDILHRLADRFPRHVVVWPVKVQGEGSAEQVAAAIRGFNALPAKHPVPKPDLIIVARGGGSLEDLWSFNEEIVVRAAAESMIPLISAVGHETDITLIDFAADRRAPTPTAAAEMAVPVRSELIAETDDFARRIIGAWIRGMDERRSDFRSAARALPLAEDLLAIPRQRFDMAADGLRRGLRANTQLHRLAFSRTSGRFTPRLLSGHVERRRERYGALALRLKAGLSANIQHHGARITRDRDRTVALAKRAQLAFKTIQSRREARLESAWKLLDALSYRGVLGRGFALVRDMTGKPVRIATAVKGGMRLDIEFTDGRVGAIADSESSAPSTSSTKVRTRGGGQGGGQGSLFGS